MPVFIYLCHVFCLFIVSWSRYEGVRPPGYETMKQQGSIILGIGTRALPFNTGCLPLSYSSNPGVNDESYRGKRENAWAKGGTIAVVLSALSTRER
jgi:hypothetical protein